MMKKRLTLSFVLTLVLSASLAFAAVPSSTSQAPGITAAPGASLSDQVGALYAPSFLGIVPPALAYTDPACTSISCTSDTQCQNNSTVQGICGIVGSACSPAFYCGGARKCFCLF